MANGRAGYFPATSLPAPAGTAPGSGTTRYTCDARGRPITTTIRYADGGQAGLSRAAGAVTDARATPALHLEMHGDHCL